MNLKKIYFMQSHFPITVISIINKMNEKYNYYRNTEWNLKKKCFTKIYTFFIFDTN